jgi:ABC-2 type transport system permease protein
LQILHGVVIKGAGLRTLWPPILVQSALAGAFLSLSVAKFKKTLV